MADKPEKKPDKKSEKRPAKRIADKRREGRDRHRPHRAHPADGRDQELNERREYELAETSAGIHEARRE